MPRTSNLLLLIALVGSLHSLAGAFQVTDCSSDDASAKLEQVDIKSCPDQSGERCEVFRGQNHTISVTFTALRSLSEANIVPFIKFRGVTRRVYLEGHNDACRLGLDCPIKPESRNTLDYTFFISNLSPMWSAEAIIKAQDQDDENIICFKFPFTIKSKQMFDLI